MAFKVTVVECPAPPQFLALLLALERKTFGKAGWEAPEIAHELAKRQTLLLVVTVDQPQSDRADSEQSQQGHTLSLGSSQAPTKPASSGRKASRKAAQPGPPSCQGEAIASGGSLSGYILGSTTSLNVHCVRLAIRAEHRRKGLGTALVQGLLRTALSQCRCISASLNVAQDNTAARALYEQAGFQEECQLLDYYSPGKHAFRYSLDDMRENPRLAAFLSLTHPAATSSTQQP